MILPQEMRTCSEPDLRTTVNDINGAENDNYKTALAERFSLDDLVGQSEDRSTSSMGEPEEQVYSCENSPREDPGIVSQLY